jgi:hypothetical protein
MGKIYKNKVYGKYTSKMAKLCGKYFIPSYYGSNQGK